MKVVTKQGQTTTNSEQNIGLRHARFSNTDTETWCNGLGFACSFLNGPPSDNLEFYATESVRARWACQGRDATPDFRRAKILE